MLHTSWYTGLMSYSKFLSISVITLLLTSCATLQLDTKSKIDWETKGKMAFTDGVDGSTASIYWRQMSEKYHIRLSGPFSINTILIDGKPGDIQVRSSDGEVTSAKTPEQLFQRKTGLVFPITSLMFWIRGLADPTYKIDKIIRSPEQQNIIKLEQRGWNITFNNYKNYKNADLPGKILLQQENMRIKIILTDWQLSN
jgi:outer membrane lipoprotein LolB